MGKGRRTRQASVQPSNFQTPRTEIFQKENSPAEFPLSPNWCLVVVSGVVFVVGDFFTFLHHGKNYRSRVWGGAVRVTQWGKEGGLDKQVSSPATSKLWGPNILCKEDSPAEFPLSPNWFVVVAWFLLLEISVIIYGLPGRKSKNWIKSLVIIIILKTDEMLLKARSYELFYPDH